MKKLIKKLTETPGISGFEEKIRELIKNEIEDYVDEVKYDSLGNLIAVKKGGDKKVMLAAHMDEIGLMVKHINKKGFVKFSKIGGINDQMLLNQTVKIHGEKTVTGVIGSKPPHRMKPKERKRVISHENMFIDIGVKNEKEAKKLISVGDPITFEGNFEMLSDKIFKAKALDNRLGCLVMIEVLKKVDSSATIYGVGTVQEEVGLKGARTSAYQINPDLAIALDVTIAGDHPGIKKEDAPVELGKGPVIVLTDASGRGIITHPKVRKLLITTAEKENIEYQLEVSEGGTTDATAIHLTRAGIPSGVLSVPTRYIHTPVSVAHLDDVKNCIKLLTKALEKYLEVIEN